MDPRQVTAPDLVGCRYRYVQRQYFPDTPPTEHSVARRQRAEAESQAIAALLPTRRGLGDGRRKPFLRVDLPGADDPEDAELSTLAAIAAEATLVTGAVFTGSDAGHRWQVVVDVLVRREDGSYAPVIFSNHRVARPDKKSVMQAVATNRLGLSRPLEVGYRPRHHVIDGYRLGLAARALAAIGRDSGRGGAIGQDRTTVFLTDTAGFQPALTAALEAGWPIVARRVKECATCRFWSRCEPELVAADDISLVLPGDKARDFRQRGITTVADLIDARAGEPSALAAAWRSGTPLLRRPAAEDVTGPHADVEIDVDMEAYLDHGAYLWGAFDGADYHGFATWKDLGGDAEAENFAKFWDWLMAARADAHAAGLTFAAYCYSANGENHWFRSTATRFGGRRFGRLVVPGLEEVNAFIASDEWRDVFVWVRRHLIGPHGIGLKIVAPEAGYTWADEGFDGEDSVHAYRRAQVVDQPGRGARETLLRYNEDDTRATAAVRAWLRDGAPGVPSVADVQ